MSVASSTSAHDRYRLAGRPVPPSALAWNLYGTGIERMGRDGAPESVDVRTPGPDQLLVRVDAVGLCFSDVKLLRLGGDHPKLYGRDLEREPTRLGHETSVTVMAVGERLAGRFRPGQRLAIQPDIYVDGRSTAYGYTIPGGLIEYQLIGPEVLAADDGAYIVPVPESLGYAETALTEPWACVEAAYSQRRRLEPLPGGRMLVFADAQIRREHAFGRVLASAGEIVLVGGEARLAATVAEVAPDVPMRTAADLESAAASGPFDDVIMLDPTSAADVSRAADLLAFRGVMNLVAEVPLDGDVEIDVGRLHYHYTAFLGTTGPDASAAYGEARNRAELRADGVTVVVGAGGPMGQMHVERALTLSAGPRLVIGVDLDAGRLGAAAAKLEPVARARGRELAIATLGPEPTSLLDLVARHTSGRGADDVVVTAPSAGAVRAAAGALAPDGMLVLFAGVPIGTRVAIDLSRTFLHGAQYTGTSGSRIADQALVVEKTAAGQLEPRRALAAIGGLRAAPEALQALMDGRFPGKIVIFPALHDLPLTALADLQASEPGVAAALAPDGTWTSAAEARLFDRHLG